MLDGSDLSILVPLWRRTSHVERVLADALAATPAAQVVFIVSADDGPVIEAVEQLDVQGVLVLGAGGQPGDYARKINTGYRITGSQHGGRPFLFTGADDLHFVPGWYDAARAALDAADPPSYTAVHVGVPGDSQVVDWITNPQQRVGVVGTNDLCNHRTINGTHSTHSLVARWYADLGGTLDQDHVIYHEGYAHEYCDDELVQTAMFRGAYAHAHEAIVEHLHPNANKSDDDDTYRRGRSLSRLSRRLYLQRRRMWGERIALRNRT